MITVPNFEIVISSLPNNHAPPTPIVALSFVWSDVSLVAPLVWTSQNTRLDLRVEGMIVTLPEVTILFPFRSVDNKSEPNKDNLLEGDDVLGVIYEHRSLFVCAFDRAGEMIASIGFLEVK